jgi:hypothetical protein
MIIEKLKIRNTIDQEKRLAKAVLKMQNLIEALNNKKTHGEVASIINKDIRLLKSFSGTDKEVRKALRRTHSKILKLVEKELKWVPKNHYRNTWLAIGLAAFGIPLGVAFSSAGNSSNLAIGIPIGMVIGMAIGSLMDKKAEKEDKQLNIEF